ncbi:hypothetical protein [Actinophytocola algeriensis]|uniref:Uncharacterized protein n=1 Tax=Actinophytocola algeriensis TaxID=1768010 RepID=A0A7W7QAU3_9PSEU|nr:hypothetical protein [Actinophytocola algeriensis]MBB4910162.1 hypothetical protein [Actinophytocola algeriensis]MBE1480850.1 hypothetical protein [Actinophytocola algeriensis]
MDKRVFDDAIGEVPPSTVDVDAVIVRGRRAAMVRRVANPAVAAGVAVVLLTGAVAYTMMRDTGGGTTVGTAPPPVSSSTTAPPSSSTAPPSSTPKGMPDAVPPPQCAGELEKATVAAARLTQATTEAVAAQRADLQLLPNAMGDYPAGTPHGPLEYHQVDPQASVEELSICDPMASFEAMATTRAGEGDGNILVVMQPAWTEHLGISCDDLTIGERTFCETTTGPLGEEIAKQVLQLEGGATMHRVEILREDGVEILVQAENIATTSKTGGAPTATAPPLGLDHLVAIGTDPRLTLFP